VLNVVEDISQANITAKEQVELHLQEKKKSLEDQLQKKKDLIKQKATWPQYILNDIESFITDLKGRVADIDNLLSPETSVHKQRLNQMRKRKASQIVEEKRYKRRKLTNQGAPRKINDEEEEFLAKCIEDKATYHGRRHDLVMYTNRQVKSRDLLNIANYRLLKSGKKMIKSATTVYNRCKAKNKRSIQAKKHIGKGLMCFKKPPKAEDKDNENTHYQRSHVKNIKMSLFSESAGTVKDYSLLHSMDDKAYLRPGTGEGFAGVRKRKILTVADAEKARKLPKYDWPQQLVYQTPASHRIMTKESVKEGDGEEKLINKIDSHFVFVRPKAIVGSSGSVWASDSVRLWHENPATFQVESSNTSTCTYTKEFSSCCAVLHDYAFLYQDMTVYEDIEKLTSNDFSEEIIDSFLQYEKKRIDVLLLKLEEILDSVTNDTIQLQQDEHMLFESRLKPVLAKISELAHSRKEMEKEELEHLCMELKSQCGNLLDILNELNLPKVKPEIAYLTDAGPGVGVSNVEVRFRDTELARLWNSDYRVRVHRSRGDSGQGEAERTNSAIADSVVDGATIEWETLKQYQGMTEDEIKEMSLEDFEAHENQRMTKNAWIVAEELVKRIDRGSCTW
jgi:hypothetical protein